MIGTTGQPILKTFDVSVSAEFRLVLDNCEKRKKVNLRNDTHDSRQRGFMNIEEPQRLKNMHASLGE
jgi:hypothetical protein